MTTEGGTTHTTTRMEGGSRTMEGGSSFMGEIMMSSLYCGSYTERAGVWKNDREQ